MGLEAPPTFYIHMGWAIKNLDHFHFLWNFLQLFFSSSKNILASLQGLDFGVIVYMPNWTRLNL
jgi:hypothetical protein